MKIISFSYFLFLLLNGQKRQTIRKPRKHARRLHLGEKVKIYWKVRSPHGFPLFTAEITQLIYKPLAKLSLEEIHADGFLSRDELYTAFCKMHKVRKAKQAWFLKHFLFTVISFKKTSPLTEEAQITYESFRVDLANETA